jgi:hypothetical protein
MHMDMKFASHLARVLFSAMLCVGAATPAAALEIKEFSAPSQRVQVGEPFPVRLRVDTSWLEPTSCAVVLMPDGLTRSDLSYQPKLGWNQQDDSWQLSETFRVTVRSQRGELKKGLMEFLWTFNTPGKHSLRIDQELSPCGFDREWNLEFEVLDSHWSALDAYLLAPAGKDVGRNLSGQLQLNERWRNAEFAVAEKDLKSLKEAIESLGSKKWEEWQSQVLQPSLRPLGIQNPRFDSMEDRYYEPLKWVSEDRRFREGEGLLALGRDRTWIQEAIASGKWVLLAQIDMGAITGQWKAQRLQAEKAAEDSRKLTQRLAQALPDAKGQYTALRVNAPKDAPKDRTDPGKVCAKSDSTQSGLMVTAYRWSKPFVAWSASKQAKGFGEVRRTLNELYEDLKSGSCRYVVVNTEDALAFVRALQRDQIGFELLDFKTAEGLFPDFQEAYGYKSAESARLALTFAADSIPDAAHADTWVKHGVITRADYDKAQSRMTTSGYAANSRYDSLSQFLEDEQTSRKDGGTAVAIKKKREAKEAAQAAADRERDLRSYPYRAELTCNNGPYGTLPVYTCLTSSNANSSVSLRNCGNWSNLDYDRLAGNVASIELCPSFEIKAQNTSEFVLTLVVKDKRTGKVLSHQTATRFRYVAVRN